MTSPRAATRRKTLSLKMLLVVGIALGVFASATPAGAGNANTPIRTPWVDGTVWDVEVHPNGTIYFGGDFASVEGQPRANLAALRPDGTLDTSFVPSVNGIVKALALNESGSRLFVGGEFTAVNGQPRQHLAAVRSWNGTVIEDWVADANDDVLQLELKGYDLYVGGAFTGIDGTSIKRLANVGVWNGDVRQWFNPWPTWIVQEMSLSADGELLYAGGAFTEVGGLPRQGLVEIATATGRPTAWAPEVGNAAVVGLHVSAHDGTVWAATWDNRLREFHPAVGTAPLSLLQGGGDVQAMLATDTSLHVGGHFSQFKKLGKVKHAGTIDLATRKLTDWQPDVGGSLGVWAIKSSPLGLVLGGDFFYAGGVYQRGLAIYPHT